jgi:hypothetical protein
MGRHLLAAKVALACRSRSFFASDRTSDCKHVREAGRMLTGAATNAAKGTQGWRILSEVAPRLGGKFAGPRKLLASVPVDSK